MRRRNLKNATERVQKYPDAVIVNPQMYCGKWLSVFQNSNPIHLEIGMGKGKFINEQAQKNPNINFIGLEKYDSVMVIGVEKWAETSLPNLKFISIDAKELPNIFVENEITKIYLNFSDPWPKARHAKRRLTSATFLPIYQQILIPQGTIEQKTDNLELFEYSLESYKENKYRILEQSYDLHNEKTNVITTEYEDKFSKRGQSIYYVLVESLKGIEHE